MFRPEEIAAIVPCLNEGRAIATVVREVREHIRSVIVVNDGSSDRTGEEAELAGAMVVHHSTPRGKGASLRTGLAFAAERGFSWALTLDGDGQHLAADIPAFLEAGSRERCTLWIGNRMPSSQRMPAVRRLVNHGMSALISAYCGTAIPDSQCGFRMIQLSTWKRLSFRSDHFEIESEMIVRFLKAGQSIGFVPIQTRYASESSKIRPVRDTIRWFRWWYQMGREFSANDFRSAQPPFESRTQDATA